MDIPLLPFSFLYSQHPLQEDNLVASTITIVQTSIDGKTMQDIEQDKDED
jgi:hypothetical protein